VHEAKYLPPKKVTCHHTGFHNSFLMCICRTWSYAIFTTANLSYDQVLSGPSVTTPTLLVTCSSWAWYKD